MSLVLLYSSDPLEKIMYQADAATYDWAPEKKKQVKKTWVYPVGWSWAHLD